MFINQAIQEMKANKNNSNLSILHKILEDKKAIHKYIQGELSSKEIDERGIKFVKPLSNSY